MSEFHRKGLPELLVVLCILAGGPARGQPSAPIIRTGADGRTSRLTNAILSRDASRIAVYLQRYEDDSRQSDIAIHDASTGEKLYAVPRSKEGERGVVFQGFSPDGKSVAIETLHELFVSGSTLEVIDPQGGAVVYTYEIRPSFMEILFLDDGRLIHTLQPERGGYGSAGRSVAVVEFPQGRRAAEFHCGEYDHPLKVCSSDGNLLIAGNEQGQNLKIMKISTARTICSLEMDRGDRLLASLFLGNGRSLRGIDPKGVIQTWDATTGKRQSRVEPQEMLRLSSVAFSADGKFLLIAGPGQIEFRDAGTLKSVGVWRLGPSPSAWAYLSTPVGQKIAVAVAPATGGDLQVLSLPAIGDLKPPDEVRKPPLTTASRGAPERSPAAEVPAHREEDLRSPRWWVDRAEAEWRSADEATRRTSIASLMSARAAAGDDQGWARMAREGETLFPKLPPGGPDPLADARASAAKWTARRLARAGKVEEALKVADANPGPRSPARYEVAIELARRGEVERAMTLITDLEKGLQSRLSDRMMQAILFDGNPALAEKLVEKIGDDAWRRRAYGRISVHLAEHGDADDVLRLAGPSGLLSDEEGISFKVIRAFGRQADGSGARRVIDSLPEKKSRTKPRRPERANELLGALAVAQIDSGHLEAAEATAASLTGNPRGWYIERLALARIERGSTREAVELSLSNSSELRFKLFRALLEHGKFDEAESILKQLRSRNDPRSSPGELSELLAAALADADRPDDAERILAAGPSPSGKAASPEDMGVPVAWRIAAARRRLGDEKAFLAARAPIARAVESAPGAPSRQEASLTLARFDMTTDNFPAIEAALPSLDPKIAMLIMTQVDPRMSGESRPPRLAHSRGLIRLLMVLEPRLSALRLHAVAAAHVKEGKLEDWLRFAAMLPSASARILSYHQMAMTLLPADPADDEEH